MCEEIDELVNSDFVNGMELLELAETRPYTQNEALSMSEILGRIYAIAHCVHCSSCGRRYELKSEEKK